MYVDNLNTFYIIDVINVALIASISRDYNKLDSLYADCQTQYQYYTLRLTLTHTDTHTHTHTLI